MLNKVFIITLLCYFGLFSGCSTQKFVKQDQSNVFVENPFYLSPARQEFIQNPAIKEKLRSNVYHYFRYVNHQFSQAVCKNFAEALQQIPWVNLHGDAHLEQYAVTDSGCGLTDFDDAATGPPIIDWMRFAVSIRLTCQMLHWEADADSLIQIFLKGYAVALDHENLNRTELPIVKSIRSEFKFEPESYFNGIHQLMLPIRAAEQDSLIQAMQDYFHYQFQKNTNLPPTYFNIVKCGASQMGVGSARDQKYLMQVTGKSTELNDDVILELKEVKDLAGIDCIQQQPVFNPLRILMAESRIADKPFTHLGYFKFRDKYFWVHAWGRLYKELKVTQSFKSVNDMKGVVFEAGIQLGKGHVKFIASPHDDLLRQELLQTLKKHQVEIKTASTQYAKMYFDAWNQFRNAK